ncbi:MAG: GntR family transcriptional regulator [Lachnospiraceae bacterium]|nr:GntR family transcriptional regulator [Lachnospiraceae bacterium]
MPWILDNNLPIYTQVLERIEIRIISGEYKPGDKLPSVRELASEAGVNPNTMQKACTELERIGLVITQRTNGRSVTTDEELIRSCKDRLIRNRMQDFVIHMQALGCGKETVITLLQQEWEEN